MNKYKISYDTENWECGDGCCGGTNTEIAINEIEIGCYGDLSYSKFSGIDKFIEVLNQNDETLKMSHTIELDEDGDLQDAIYLNNNLITNSTWECQVYTDILNKLELAYHYVLYELVWDIWKKEKRLVLVVEEDVFVNASDT